jgi:hypothetical protein
VREREREEGQRESERVRDRERERNGAAVCSKKLQKERENCAIATVVLDSVAR